MRASRAIFSFGAKELFEKYPDIIGNIDALENIALNNTRVESTSILNSSRSRMCTFLEELRMIKENLNELDEKVQKTNNPIHDNQYKYNEVLDEDKLTQYEIPIKYSYIENQQDNTSLNKYANKHKELYYKIDDNKDEENLNSLSQYEIQSKGSTSKRKHENNEEVMRELYQYEKINNRQIFNKENYKDEMTGSVDHIRRPQNA